MISPSNNPEEPSSESPFLVLLTEEVNEARAGCRPVASLAEGIGQIVLAVAGLLLEAQPDSAEQNPEKLIEQLLMLATDCARTAEAVVLPQLAED